MSSCCARSRRAHRAAVEVADPGPDGGDAGLRGEHEPSRLHRPVAAYRRPDRGTPGADVVTYVDLDSEMAAVSSWSGIPFVRRWRHQDPGNPAAPLNCRSAASDVLARSSGAPGPEQEATRGISGRTTTWCSRPPVGKLDNASHVLRAFRQVVAAAGLDPRSGRRASYGTRFVSVLSDADVPIERISRSGRPQEHSHDGDDLPQADPAGDCCTARTSWTGSSRAARIAMLSYSLSYSDRPGQVQRESHAF